MKRCLHILTGFTAVGKTTFSLDWAERHGAEIVSCDSLCFYRGMDIGTAKPDKEARSRAPHHLIDVTDVADPYSIGKYIREARRVVKEIRSRGRSVLIVGGSGFYLRAFFEPVVDDIEITDELRAESGQQFESQSLEQSVAQLRRMNPDGLEGLDVSNPRRVFNALLRCRASGLPLTDLKRRLARRPGPFQDFAKRVLVLSRPREELERRIRQRVDRMLEEGLVEEVSGLLEKGIEQNPSAAQAIGYRETLAFLRGELEESELAPMIALHTRQLLKKQRTWFKKFLPPEAVIDLSLSSPPQQWHHLDPDTK